MKGKVSTLTRREGRCHGHAPLLCKVSRVRASCERRRYSSTVQSHARTTLQERIGCGGSSTLTALTARGSSDRSLGFRSTVKTYAASNEPSLPSGGDQDDPSSGPGLIRVLLNAPTLAERYFERKWWRKPLWYFLIFGFAYFAANTISLSFGAKAVNDVVAAVLVVVFYEASSRVVYRAKKRTVWHWLLHYFKLGVVIGFLMDSYKLGG